MLAGTGVTLNQDRAAGQTHQVKSHPGRDSAAQLLLSRAGGVVGRTCGWRCQHPYPICIKFKGEFACIKILPRTWLFLYSVYGSLEIQ